MKSFFNSLLGRKKASGQSRSMTGQSKRPEVVEVIKPEPRANIYLVATDEEFSFRKPYMNAHCKPVTLPISLFGSAKYWRDIDLISISARMTLVYAKFGNWEPEHLRKWVQATMASEKIMFCVNPERGFLKPQSDEFRVAIRTASISGEPFVVFCKWEVPWP
ncbi:hypothetical protein INS49_014164 [Diaporthe citri]|uniref:uncharacterized protein n=1 Tax=Diaporthe citri TaxID=83186 RepID=UPI001C7EE0D6|nr:uncharacterized protein INS49_014164 [Diaporthe citri]KAG6358280.1 hypothetical protein INS49_014164 [Diaporthe citri]